MIEFLLEIVVEFVFEFLLTLVGEVLAEVFSSATSRLVLPKQLKQFGPYVLIPAFACAGVALGAMSTWIFPNHFITSPSLRLANLFLTPTFVGITSALGSALIRGENSQKEMAQHAAQGFLFALALVLTRYFMAV